MNVIIFGASGSVGKHLTEQALAEGHCVTAFTRAPETFELSHINLRVQEGNVLDADAVRSAIAGQDVVFCTLGAGRNASLRSAGTRNIIEGMEQAGVRRLICQTTLGAGDSAGTLTFFWKYIMFGMLLRGAFKDHGRQEDLVHQSDLEWTIVRPGAFTDGPLTGQYQYGFPGDQTGLSLKISRADVAHFLLQQLNGEQFMKRAVNLCY